MKLIKNNLVEIFLLIGLILISIGFFIYSTILGFIVTGFLLISLSFITFKFGGGD